MKSPDEIRAAIRTLIRLIEIDPEQSRYLGGIWDALSWTLDDGGEAFEKLLQQSQAFFQRALERN